MPWKLVTLSLSQPMEGNARRTSSGLTAHIIRLLEAPDGVKFFNIRLSPVALRLHLGIEDQQRADKAKSPVWLNCDRTIAVDQV